MTLPALHLPATIVAAIVAQAQAAYPRECCGLLAGQAGRIVKHYPITNTYQGDDFYLMQPGEQYRALIEIDRQDWQLLVIYHSHPVSVAYPSRRDIAHACWEGTSEPIHPDTYYVICSLADRQRPILRAFMLQAHERVAEALIVVDPATTVSSQV